MDLSHLSQLVQNHRPTLQSARGEYAVLRISDTSWRSPAANPFPAPRRTCI